MIYSVIANVAVAAQNIRKTNHEPKEEDLNKLAIGYRLILGIALGITTQTAHADSGREQVESFVAQFTQLIEEKKGSYLDLDDPQTYISAWPQFSKKLLLQKGINPAELKWSGSIRTKWATVSSNSNETTIVLVDGDVLGKPPSNPQTVVAEFLSFETKLVPGEGWKIVVNKDIDSEYVLIKRRGYLSWRRYVSEGYKNVIDRVYRGEAADRQNRERDQVARDEQYRRDAPARQARQMCEAQKQTCYASCPPRAEGFRLDSSARVQCVIQCDRINCN